MRRSWSVFVLVVGMLAGGAVPAAMAAGPEGGRAAERSLLAELDARGATVLRHAETGAVRSIGGTPRRPAASSADLRGPTTAREAARRFLSRYGSLFGAAAADLRVTRVDADTTGGKTVRHQQSHRGVPVIAGELLVHVDRDLDVVSASGEAAPSLDLEVQPTIPARQASQTAKAAVAKALGIRAHTLGATAPVLSVYDPSLLGGPGIRVARLVWRTEVQDLARAIDWFVLIDAHTGAVTLRFDQLPAAKNRLTCDANNTSNKYPCASPYARTESSGASGIAEVDRAHLFTGHTYDFFFNRFGRDSLDGAGMSLVSTVRYCDPSSLCPYENAFWDGSQMVYGDGTTVDDVVGHELAHGVTDFTSSLFYYYQSGAINESISDVFGELIDITNGTADDNATTRWQIGEGSSLGVIRDMEDPTLHQQPDSMQDGWYYAGTGDNGGVHYNSGVGNKAAYLMVDGGTFNGQAITAIGVDKTAAIWYRVETAHLSSGSDYADLGTALNQACAALVGSSVKNSAGTVTGTIASSDCTQVGKAVTATEMALQPTDPDAQAPDAPICDSGSPSNILYDRIDAGASGWGVTGGTSSYGWFLDSGYATSNPYHLYGFMDNDASVPAITRTNGTVIPASAYLHFRHGWEFEYDSWYGTNYDGGVVEYSINGGSSWTDASTLFTHGGYNGTITAGTGNPIAGRSGFVRLSNGYRSSRLTLASLAGQTVKFRFRISSDSLIGWLGWVIDDFRIYTCGTSDTTPPTVTAPDAVFRTVGISTSSTPIPLHVSFTAMDTSGIADTTLQQKVNTGSFTDVALSGVQSAKNLNVGVSNTTTRQFRSSATDTAGNTSAFSTGPVFKVKAVQNGAAAVVQGGTWTNQSNSNFYGGSVRYSGAAGRSQSLTRTGTDFAIVSTKGPNRGQAAVYVDGVFKTNVDLYNATTQYRRIVYSISFPTAASHTIELRVLGTRNPSSTSNRVDFDAFLTMEP